MATVRKAYSFSNQFAYLSPPHVNKTGDGLFFFSSSLLSSRAECGRITSSAHGRFWTHEVSGALPRVCPNFILCHSCRSLTFDSSLYFLSAHDKDTGDPTHNS